ncbi:MAG: dipicolinate synthase subunit B [Firmicutes bacterium HGW-Firmicutes-1]|jgi:dipicolinate synthase subunit B|nr:MAG: dipicolinate synthase subunit B [Firmicutes bacterium HGW-Firmicutes-1]
MLLKDVKIAFALTGSFCVFDKVFPQIELLVKEGALVYPVVSGAVASTDSRFGKASDFLERLTKITGNPVIENMVEAEPLGVVYPVDITIISPCTGNTLSKLSDGATDSAPLMVAKGQFRNSKPVVIGIATNDGLGINGKSLGILLATKNVYFIPFGQDNYKDKPNSLVSKFDLTLPTILEALKGSQIQPILEKY